MHYAVFPIILIILVIGSLGIQAKQRFFNISDILSALKPSKSNGVQVQGDCSYKITGDLTDPHPLFLKHNSTQLLLPDSSGIVNIKNGQHFDIYCTTGFADPLPNKTKISPQCLQGSYFLVDGSIRNFKEFSCIEWSVYTARRTNRTCNGGTILIDIGFEIDGDNFVHVMDVCHDEVNEVTRYVHHKMNPSSQGYQRYATRPLFITGDFFKGRDVNEVYTKVKQKKTFDAILGENTTKYFNSSDLYLARGHMCAKADHVYGAVQRATFFFVNAAPQWQAFNAGNWEVVEHSVRKFIADREIDVDCYSGTWGVSTLPNVNGTETELYLDFDENNNGLIPVPKIYFRVVIEPATRKGIVLVGVNNPYVSLEQIYGEYVICDNVIDRITWIHWNKENLEEGYLYACEVAQFRKVVKDLPVFDVKELLY